MLAANAHAPRSLFKRSTAADKKPRLPSVETADQHELSAIHGWRSCWSAQIRWLLVPVALAICPKRNQLRQRADRTRRRLTLLRGYHLFMSTEMLNEDTWTSPEITQAFESQPKQMTYAGVAVKATFFLVLVAGFATVGWNNAATFAGRGSGLIYLVGYIILIGITIAAAHNPRLALVAGLFYSGLTGLWMGAISRYYNEVWEGIVGIALLGTLAIMFAMLILYSLRVFRVTAKVAKVLISMAFAVAILYFFSFILSLFGASLNLLYGGNPVSIVIGIIILAIASSMLLLDFATIESGVKSGAPKAAEWYAALGLTSSLVWIYLEVLRLLARIAARNQ
jgi:uncharacterized YccA/Bax inhibitor family protein